MFFQITVTPKSEETKENCVSTSQRMNNNAFGNDFPSETKKIISPENILGYGKKINITKKRWKRVTLGSFLKRMESL